VIGLLNKMKDLAYTTDNVQYEFWTMQAAMSRLVSMRQDPRESLNNFCKRFLGQLDVTEDVWGKLIPNNMKGKKAEEQEKARNKYLACVFLAAVDRDKYKKAVDDLNNDFLLGNTNYPEDVPGMMTLLTNRRGGGKSRQIDAIRDGIGRASFAQRQQGSSQRETRICYNCNERGHIARDCPARDGNNSPGVVQPRARQ